MGGILEVAVPAILSVTLSEVATTVAVTGVALSVAGAVTHDKNLQYAGMAMGAAGAIVGIGGAIAGVGGMTLGEAGSAISDFMTGGSAAEMTAQESLGQGIVAASNPQYAETMSVTSPLQNQEALGQGVVAGTKGMPPPAPTPLAQVPPGADTARTATARA